MFEPVYRSRPGADAMRPAAAERAEQIAPGLWCSPGLSNSYLLTTDDGRVVVNTGMGFEGPVHRANFDAVDCSPVRYIILTQGHVDHVGGLDSVRDPRQRLLHRRTGPSGATTTSASSRIGPAAAPSPSKTR